MSTIAAGSTDPGPEVSRAYLAASGVIAVAGLAWAYAPSLVNLIGRWQRDDNYSHGFFVLPIAAIILWQRRDRLAEPAIGPSRWGIAALAALLAARAWLFESNEIWAEDATLVLAATLITLAIGGPALIRWAWPALLFSCFMIPLPNSLNALLAAPLQSLATAGSVTILQATGLPVFAEGNVIIVGGEKLEVARACNGLSMLLSFATLVAAMVVLTRRPLRERVALLLSIVPVALACNILRIAATGWATHLAGHEVEAAHDWAGLAMMPVALAMIFAETKILSWVFFEVEVPIGSVGLIRPVPSGGAR